jgi:hypothetical protein
MISFERFWTRMIVDMRHCWESTEIDHIRCRQTKFLWPQKQSAAYLPGLECFDSKVCHHSYPLFIYVLLSNLMKLIGCSKSCQQATKMMVVGFVAQTGRAHHNIPSPLHHSQYHLVSFIFAINGSSYRCNLRQTFHCLRRVWSWKCLVSGKHIAYKALILNQRFPACGYLPTFVHYHIQRFINQ